jgi:uncharacterized protein YkwD
MQQYLLGIFLLVVFANSKMSTDEKKLDFDLKNLTIVYRDFFDLNEILSRQAKNFTTAQRKFQRDMLNAHNTYRSRHCVRSLRLDDNLSRSAQNYAQRLANMNTMVHSGIKGLGENLYTMSSSNKITNVAGE